MVNVENAGCRVDLAGGGSTPQDPHPKDIYVGPALEHLDRALAWCKSLGLQAAWVPRQIPINPTRLDSGIWRGVNHPTAMGPNWPTGDWSPLEPRAKGSPNR